MLSPQKLNDIATETRWNHLRESLISPQKLMKSPKRINEIATENQWNRQIELMISPQKINEIATENHWYRHRKSLISPKKLNDSILVLIWSWFTNLQPHKTVQWDNLLPYYWEFEVLALINVNKRLVFVCSVIRRSVGLSFIPSLKEHQAL